MSLKVQELITVQTAVGSSYPMSNDHVVLSTSFQKIRFANGLDGMMIGLNFRASIRVNVFLFLVVVL
jgi:hypothetical protein